MEEQNIQYKIQEKRQELERLEQIEKKQQQKQKQQQKKEKLEIDKIQKKKEMQAHQEYKLETIKKIEDNKKELDKHQTYLTQISNQIEKKENDTKEELEIIIQEFNNRHGLLQLRETKKELVTLIKECEEKKYGNCKHFQKDRFASSEHKSIYNDWTCTVCNYRHIEPPDYW